MPYKRIEIFKRADSMVVAHDAFSNDIEGPRLRPTDEVALKIAALLVADLLHTAEEVARRKSIGALIEGVGGEGGDKPVK